MSHTIPVAATVGAVLSLAMPLAAQEIDPLVKRGA